MIEKLKEDIDQAFGKGVVEILQEGMQPTLLVKKDSLVELCLWLRDHSAYYFDFLSNITAVDYHPEHRFALVYNLASIPFQLQLNLRVELPNEGRSERDLPEVDSVSSVWRTADWHEREAYDLMGIFFNNHPDLRRILLPDDWVGHPLRKDHEEAEYYHGIPIKNN